VNEVDENASNAPQTSKKRKRKRKKITAVVNEVENASDAPQTIKKKRRKRTFTSAKVRSQIKKAGQINLKKLKGVKVTGRRILNNVNHLIPNMSNTLLCKCITFLL